MPWQPNQQYHFFHTIAVEDQIRTVHLDDSRPQQLVSNLSISDFVPSSSDYKRLCSDLIVLVPHIVVAEMSTSQFMDEAVPDHILHQYSREMAQSSVVVGHYNYFIAVTTSMQQFLIVLMFPFTAPTWYNFQEREHQWWKDRNHGELTPIRPNQVCWFFKRNWWWPPDLCMSQKCKTSSTRFSYCCWEDGRFAASCWRLAYKDVPEVRMVMVSLWLNEEFTETADKYI